MSNTAPLSKPFNHDLPTLLRLIAITLIVAGHFDLFKYGGGGAALLRNLRSSSRCEII